MCRSQHNGGRRCIRPELSRLLASARQRIARYGRRCDAAEDSQDIAGLDKNLALFTKAMGDHDELEGRQVTEFDTTASAADQYTDESTRSMTDEELILKSDDLWHDPAAQDAVLEILTRRQESAERDDTESAADHDAGAADENHASEIDSPGTDPGDEHDPWADDRPAPWGDEVVDSHNGIDNNPLTNPIARRRETASERVRAEYDAWQITRWDQAEHETHGYMVNAEGRRAGVTPSGLFHSPAATIRRYASPELLSWYQSNGYISLAAFRYNALNRPSDRKAAERSQREAFANAAA